jgi:rSAM/selenodomain-associated transferase 2
VPVSVIIPTLNEEERIGAAIESAFRAGASEVIVVDGGSRDATLAIAAAAGARTIAGETVRARQLNRGAAAATQETLIFLHADTLLPEGAVAAVEDARRAGAVFGGFRIAFPERGLEKVAALINRRTSLTRAPWGDQAQFLRRETFLAIGGYPDLPIMEDYELARRLKRTGPTVLLPLAVRTSGRRFVQNGLFRTAATNWLIVLAYHLGVSPDRLARWYRGR